MVDFPHKHLIWLKLVEQNENIRQLKYRTFQQTTDPLVFRVLAQKIQLYSIAHNKIKSVFKDTCEREALLSTSNSNNSLPSALDQVIHDQEDSIKSKYMN
jgi:hypothetical protein